MSEPGLEIETFRNVLFNRAQDVGWALCIGAGTSVGILPTWETLVKELVRTEKSLRGKHRAFRRLRTSIMPEAMIQATKTRLGQDDDEFAQQLGKVLYAAFKKKVGPADWHRCAEALSAISPGNLDANRWKMFLDIMGAHYPNASALGLARVVYTAVKLDRTNARQPGNPFPPIAPAAVLTFNAEPVLYSLIHAHAATDLDWGVRLAHRRVVDRVNLGISYRAPGRIPYIFCHGLLPLPDAGQQFERSLSAEKLVFCEGEYLALANNSFSWASSMFLSTAVQRTLVFVGLSFTDQNLRRWLAWVYSNRRTEIALRQQQKGANAPHSPAYGHYWINKRPQTREEASWLEASVEHLGVRLVWIDDWADIEICLRSALFGTS